MNTHPQLGSSIAPRVIQLLVAYPYPSFDTQSNFTTAIQFSHNQQLALSILSTTPTWLASWQSCWLHEREFMMRNFCCVTVLQAQGGLCQAVRMGLLLMIRVSLAY